MSGHCSFAEVGGGVLRVLLLLFWVLALTI
jgi:hypothetical protein